MADESLLADGFEKAFIGWFQRCSEPRVAVYDYDKAVKILMKRDGMSRDEAEEFIDFNVTGAWLGKGTPAFLIKSTLDQFNELVDE